MPFLLFNIIKIRCSLHTGVWTKCRKGLDKPWIIIGQSLDEVLTNLGLIYSLSNYYPGFVHNPILIQPLSSVNHQVIQPMSNVYQCPIIIQSLSRVHLGIIHTLSSNFPLFQDNVKVPIALSMLIQARVFPSLDKIRIKTGYHESISTSTAQFFWSMQAQIKYG